MPPLVPLRPAADLPNFEGMAVLIPVRRGAQWILLNRLDVIQDPRRRIALQAFCLLFFELLCIRWITSYVRYLAYFNNVILLAAFLGMGLGMLAARRENFRYPPFPWMFLCLVLTVAWNRFEFQFSSTSVLYYGAGETQVAPFEKFLILPLIFTLVAATFIPLARPLGKLFQTLPPLQSYTYDILGSLAGTAAFFLVARLSLPPVTWFAALTAGVVALTQTRREAALHLLPMLIATGVAGWLQAGSYWSPYYKIRLTPAADGYILDVNNTGHQQMCHWELKEPFYRRVYELFPERRFQSVLILGAGSGSDTATALAHGAEKVTAVEIDPVIARLGKEFNPDRPYQDPRVRLVNQDGRAYLRNSTEKFDLIIFALPDSLTLTSSIANVRLESFLLTIDSIRSARERLSENGLLVLYNYYRQDWFIDKLAGMMARVFNGPPFVSTYGGWGRAAVLIAGPGLDPLHLSPYREAQQRTREVQVIGEGLWTPQQAYQPASDDWPFIYLQKPSFPSIYIKAIGTILLLSCLGFALVAPKSGRRINWHMFFLGAAFSLLEVRALISFSLLFGNTWQVNSLVFFAILLSVLLAIQVNELYPTRRGSWFYVFLYGSLLLNLLLPGEKILLDNPVLRYLLASSLTFAPIFFANLVFSNSFRDTSSADQALASNLLGLMTGAALEYFSMLTGYHALLWGALALYALAGWARPSARPT